jgi:hypothetical protein
MGIDLSWAATIDWVALAVDVILPVIAILVPTIIAIALFRAERRTARLEAKRARRLDAGAEVIVALAPMASIQPTTLMTERLWDVRARISVYRAWSDTDDSSGDWLALRHREGMHLWAQIMEDIDAAGGINRVAPHELENMLMPAHQWAAMTIEMFSGWLAGYADMSVLLDDGARIIQEFGLPPTPDWSGDATASD